MPMKLWHMHLMYRKSLKKANTRGSKGEVQIFASSQATPTSQGAGKPWGGASFGYNHATQTRTPQPTTHPGVNITGMICIVSGRGNPCGTLPGGR
jgi:hypothetical protein